MPPYIHPRPGLRALLAVAFVLLPIVSVPPQADAVSPDSTDPPTGSGRVIVAFDSLPTDLALGERFLGSPVVHLDETLRFLVVETPVPEVVLVAARNAPGVRYAAPSGTYRTMLTPDDPYYGDLYGMTQIRADRAWDTLTGGSARRVCVVDTGIDAAHEDLAGRIVGGYDFVNDDSDATDDHGHGTHVSGTVGAVMNNVKGVAGVAQVEILGAKVLSAAGWGYHEWVASGIRWCADNGGDIISMSLGGGYSQVVDDAVSYAWGQGALLVSAAGNSDYKGYCEKCVSYPAALPESMAVACTTQQEDKCYFSSLGPQVEIAAPGYQILSTCSGHLPLCEPDVCGSTATPGYGRCSGTSMSTPHVSGVAALVWNAAPSLSNCEVRHVLRLAARDLGVSGWDDAFGLGVVDAEAAVSLALRAASGAASLPTRCDFSPPVCGFDHHAVTSAMVVDASRLLHDGADDDRGEGLALGRNRWIPENDAERVLRNSLAGCLGTDAVIDLVVFGSIARGSATGYSDVDAFLIVADDVIRDVRRLRALRSRVLAAGRAVLTYQPMQHHGFLVATPRLLRNASAAFGLPAEALETTSSLFGRPTEAIFQRGDPGASERFQMLARSLLRTASWPDHPWRLHRTVAMFELAPTLYLQATGSPCAKHESFDMAREDFPGQWDPYAVLYDVRQRWPREQRPVLRLSASMLRNPWTAVAVWRRLPSAVPSSVEGLLGEDCLHGLQDIIRSMASRIR